MMVLHRFLRRLLPGGFRRRHGEAMEEAFRDALEAAARQGPGATVRLWLREMVDVATTAVRLRRRSGSKGRGGAREAASAHPATTTGRGGVGMGQRLTTGMDDLRHAWRSVVRRPGFTLFAAGTLALGIGATTAMFSAVESVVLNPLPYAGADRMVTLWRSMGSGMMVQPSGDMAETLFEGNDLFEDMVVFRSRNDVALTGAGEATHLSALQVEADFDDFLGAGPRIGRSFTEEEVAGDRRVAVLGHDLWQTRFGGDPGALGRTITLDGEPWTVIGVLPPRMPAPNAMEGRIDLWLPLAPDRGTAYTTRVGRTAPGITPEVLQERIDALTAHAAASGVTPEPWSVQAKPVAELASAGVRDNLRILMVAVVVLLLIACVNVANLLLSRGIARRRETDVRLALGAGRGRLLRQLFLESLLLGVLGCALGVLLAWGAVEGMVGLATAPGQSGNRGLSVLEAVRLNGHVLAFSVATALASATLFGLVAGLLGWTTGSLSGLAGGARGSDGGGRFRWGMVTVEVALSFSLLVGSVLVLGSLSRMMSRTPGFDAGSAVTMQVSLPSWKYEAEERMEVFRRLRDNLERLPGVSRVTWAGGVPPEMGIVFGRAEVEGREPDDSQTVFHGGGIDHAFFGTLGIPLLEGRGFTEEEAREGADVVVLGETAAARLFPDGEAVGRRMRLTGADWSVVVGVASDVAVRGLAGDVPEMQMYVPLTYAGGWLALRVAGDPGLVMGELRSILADAEPGAVIQQLGTIEGMMRASLRRELFTTTLLGAFALLAVLLSAIGLYGVVSQVVGQRTREFGIRLSLGARAAEVSGLVLRQGLVSTLVGVAFGALLAWLGLRVLASKLFGLEETAAAPAYAVAALVLTLTTLAACWAPARRAARVDPSEALRAE